MPAGSWVMPERREFLIGAAAAAAFATAEFLRPRTNIRLFKGEHLEDVVPRRFGEWSEYPGGYVVAPTTPNSLADRLYSATLTRVFLSSNPEHPPVMLLVAYGGVQSDLLQLHRPEACYPAVGMAIEERKDGVVPLSGSQGVPSVFLSAVNAERLEDIVYWTRLGEDLPRSAGEQRNDRLRAAMRGTIGDGILVRASTVRVEGAPNWPYLAEFLAELTRSLKPEMRPGFVGTRLANTIA